eukprot:2462854-Pleurochrysis_carterae.AAC.5
MPLADPVIHHRGFRGGFRTLATRARAQKSFTPDPLLLDMRMRQGGHCTAAVPTQSAARTCTISRPRRAQLMLSISSAKF